MICPFCQHDLDVNEGFCPNCVAVYPTRRGIPFSVKLRALALSGLMLIGSAIILTRCVTNYIQSDTVVPECIAYSTGRNCQISTGQFTLSPQGSQFGGPDLKSPELQQLLLMWQNGTQPTQNSPYSTPKKTPSR